MEVITLNVGQGAMALVRHQRELIVVDARIPPAGDDFSHIKKALTIFAKAHFVRGLVLTGFDRDHADVSGVALVLRKYRPDWVAYPDYESDTESYTSVQEIIKDEGHVRRNTLVPLRNIPITMASLRGLNLGSLSPAFDFRFFSPHPKDMDSSNNCSIVVKITGKGSDGFSYLVTGDTENPRWEIINSIFGNQLASHVMAAPHHGSRDATNGDTLLHVSPNTILISAGVDNPFGHPNPAVVRAFAAVAKHVFSTSMDGGSSLHTKRLANDFRTILFQG